MAEQKGKVVNLDRFLGKVRNRIYKVGIELEGGWDELPGATQLVHDGSVVFADQNAQRYAAVHGRYPANFKLPRHVGELPSRPMPVEDFPKWIKQFYPQYVNATCGLHVHQSFKHALTYERLMVPEYQATVVEYVRRWAKEALPADHCIWERLDGKSVYCQDKYYADEQARQSVKDHDQHRHGHRYTVANYCFALHGTLEIRLLPMMPNAKTATEAIQRLLDITSAFLVETAISDTKTLKERKESAREKPIVAAETIPPDDVFKEEIVENI